MRKYIFLFFPILLKNIEHKTNEIYKGNSEKYKGKIKNQDISVFGPKHNFVEYIRWLAAFLGS